jgi:hypothetical protein
VQLYLPSKGNFNKDFLKAILEGKKALLPMSELKPINILRYDEVSVKRMYN